MKSSKPQSALASMRELVEQGKTRFAIDTRGMIASYRVIDGFPALQSSLSQIAIAALAETVIDFAERQVSPDAPQFAVLDDHPEAVRAGIEFVVRRETDALLQDRYSHYSELHDAKRKAASWFIANAPRWLEKLPKRETREDKMARTIKLLLSIIETPERHRERKVCEAAISIARDLVTEQEGA